MKIELDENAAETCCTTVIAMAVLALFAILVFGIGGCVRGMDKDRIEAGLVQKPTEGLTGYHWTKP